MNHRTSIASLAAAALAVAALAACGGDDEPTAESATAAAPTTEAEPGATADLSGAKDYLQEHTGLLAGFTAEFAADAQAYNDLAEEAGFCASRAGR